MGNLIDRVPLTCGGGTHAVLDHGRFLRIRCNKQGCPDCKEAKAAGYRTYHVWDLEYISRQWTEYEPAPRRINHKEQHHG